ncbi:hypothetical protein Rhopal_004982-T1 [Rhodotorula paludigena]|uniref:RalA-binding protein 1 n=1 Tax=Rhodotorula paludigena TaxID=86838 RepID=A0AAV5GRS3_9BASI|nr:hypothetical protein Rhopal_004982-T1 [Rhodotorula paludigena]
MPADSGTVSISSLLAEHQNDPHRALATLVSRFNRLASEHHVLRQEKDTALQAAERSAQENQQLWRSLKALGSSSPRPVVARQNSDSRESGPSSGGGVRGLGIGGSGSGLETPTSRGLRRGLSSDSNSHPRLDLPSGAGGGSSSSHHSSPRIDEGAQWSDNPPSAEPSPRFPSAAHFAASSAAGLRSKAATPPPNGSPRQHDPISASNLRKASSLDLGRGAPATSSEGDGSRAVAAGESAHGQAAEDQLEALRLTDEAPRTPPQQLAKSVLAKRRQSSPRISASSSMPMLSDPALDARRFLPSIAPVSPFFDEEAAAARREREASTSTSTSTSAAGEQLQQLQLPQADSGRRHRTFSDNTHQTLSSAFDDRLQNLPTRSSSTNVLGSASSSHSLATLSELSAPRERRPSAPSSRLQQSYGPPDGDVPPTSASQPTSRRPSAINTSALPPTPSLSHPLPPPPAPTPPPTVRPSLVPAVLPYARVRVGSSNIRLNERNKEVISFLIDVDVTVPPEADVESHRGGSAKWRVEKLYSDVLGLDSQVKSKTNRQESRSMASLPDKSLFKDHAPHKSDQRKAVLERYLQTLLTIPLRDRSAICTFLNSDVVPDAPIAPPASGAMEGWLTKRGRNFGGWQTRYYVLSPGSALAYYDSPGGNKLGDIPLSAATIGRQSSRATDVGEDAYLHAFLIRVQSEKEEADHILCAENDEARDAWVQAITRYLPRYGERSGSMSGASGASAKPNGLVASSSTGSGLGAGSEKGQQQGSAGGSNAPLPAPPVPTVISPEPETPQPKERRRSGSGPSSVGAQQEQQSQEPQSRGLSARSAGELPSSVSLPSNLDALARGMPALEGASKKISTISEAPESGSTTPGGPTSSSSRSNKLQAPSSRRPSADRTLSPDRRPEPVGPLPPPPVSTSKYSASNVSGPMNAVPLPSGYDFKKAERQKKTKSSFWNFASRGSNDKNASTSPVQQLAAVPTRPIFGVPLKEAVSVSRIRPGLELPAIVYRCVEYLEAKNAEHEEGIFRLSGSANVIRMLKDRFNADGDVNLLQSAEYYDPHAIAGLLKQYLRELPDHLLTRELHNEFLRVIDLRDRRDRVNALGRLVARLPIEEYTLFRFFFAHLCLIAQNAETSKMNLRNLGIVFAPTLAIPQPLFSLFLVEFDLIFAVESETGTAKPIMVDKDPTATESPNSERRGNRNSLLYEASGAGELEQKLEKLRENDEGEDDPTGDPLDESGDITADEDISSAEPLTPASPYAGQGGLAPHGLSIPSTPRSPGLPSSPRPGSTF